MKRLHRPQPTPPVLYLLFLLACLVMGHLIGIIVYRLLG